MSTSDSHASPARHVPNIEGRLAQARRLIAAGDLPGARAVSDSILGQHPHHAGALIQRSRLESSDDNYRLARDYALSAYRSGIHNKRQCLHLLRRLKTFNLIDELHDLVPRLAPELLRDVDIATLLSTLFQALNQPQRALEYLLEAEQHNPAAASVQLGIGTAMLSLGRFEEAEQRLAECVRLDPDSAPAWWQLQRLRRQNASSSHVAELQRRVERADGPRSTALLAYALHRELDEVGDHAGAADALELACTSMKKVVPYSADEDERLFAALKSLPVAEARPRLYRPTVSFTPVFIVGMHRSGTTLLELLLSRHDDICPGGELYDFTSQLRLAADHHCSTELDLRIVEASDSFDYDAIGQGYLNSVDWRRSGQRFVTDKLPSNFLNIGFILRALPDAKILHMSRDPMETCFSNLREPFSDSTCRYSYDQAELAAYYQRYFNLMKHWNKCFPGRIHEVTYAALATDPAAELRRVTNHLGIGFQPAMLDADPASRSINTASAVQVRQKPGLPLQPKWQPYRDYLTPLVWRLSEIGQRY
jgi:tetratricopeptide (TPR) repeat protein